MCRCSSASTPYRTSTNSPASCNTARATAVVHVVRPATPLYVPAARLLSFLGPGWHADAGRVGHGKWTLLCRR
jgi:hypothetical protein